MWPPHHSPKSPLQQLWFPQVVKRISAQTAAFPVETDGMPGLSGCTEHKRGSTTCCSPAVSRWPLRDTRVQKRRRRKEGQRSNAPQSTVSSVLGEEEEEEAAAVVVVVVVGGDAGRCLRLSWLLHLHRNRRHTEGDHELQLSESSPPRGGAGAGREGRAAACTLQLAPRLRPQRDSYSSLSPYYLLFLWSDWGAIPLMCAVSVIIPLQYRWWNVTKYFYSRIVLKHTLMVLVLHFSLLFSCHFLLLLHCIMAALRYPHTKHRESLENMMLC